MGGRYQHSMALATVSDQFQEGASDGLFLDLDVQPHVWAGLEQLPERGHSNTVATERRSSVQI
jgi:hypothetical protein